MKSILLKLPVGVQIPDGTELGDCFQAMATFKMGSNGEVSLEEVDGEPLDPKAKEDDEVNDSANDDTSQPGPSSTLRNLLAGAQGGQ